MATTIRDVAERAGVSKATVSYILNGREHRIRITDETKRRVLEAVRELNYHPNGLARGLALKRTDTIALVMQYARMFSGWSGFTGTMMRGLTEAAFEAGVDLMLYTCERPSPEQEASALTDGRIDGALLLRDRDDPLPGLLCARGLPALQIFARNADEAVPYVDCDNRAIGRLAAEYLIGLGHRRILHIAGPASSSAAFDRLRGLSEGLQAAGAPLRPEWTIEMTYAGASFDAVERVLRSSDRPSALFAWADDVAIRAMSVAQGLGLRVPEDLSVLGCDSTEICDHTTPALTSIRQPIREMAAHAVAVLVRRIRAEADELQSVVFDPAIDVRASCAPIAQGGQDRAC